MSTYNNNIKSPILILKYFLKYVGEDIQIDEAEDSSSAACSFPDPFDYVYSNLPHSTHVLKPEPNCSKCDAKRFQYETKGFCCRDGKIGLVHPDTPTELMRLWSSGDSDARHFRENIRFFNGHFSFTSLGVNLDDRYSNMRSGVYTFRAHGQIYHNLHSFGSRDSGPNHLELYFYDDDPTLNHRFRRSPGLDQHVIRSLVNILHDNPYSQTFRSLGQVDDLQDYRIALNLDNKLDQRTYNVPITSEVAAVWVEGNENQCGFDRSIVLFGNNNTKYTIKAYHGCYDPLSYPLFFPSGELGWHTDIPYAEVSMDHLGMVRQNNPDEEG